MPSEIRIFIPTLKILKKRTNTAESILKKRVIRNNTKSKELLYELLPGFNKWKKLEYSILIQTLPAEKFA